jgi:hypothetical protein
MAARAAELLPVPYFHVVFTLPDELAALALGNKRVVYGLLMRAVGETLLELAADAKHLGGRIGFLAILHTWCAVTKTRTGSLRRSAARLLAAFLQRVQVPSR